MQALAEMPDSVIDRMIMAKATIIADAQREGARGLNRKGYGTGTTADSLEISPITGSDVGRSCLVRFRGTRPNGHSTKRTAEVAYMNEYGGRGLKPARHFITAANERSERAAEDAAEAIFLEWQNSK